MLKTRCVACFCFAAWVAVFPLHAERPERDLTSWAPVTVADAIQMTQWADRDYGAGGSSEGKVAVFSPDGLRFLLILKKGNIAANTNDFSLLLFDTDAAFSDPKPEILLTMSSSSNRPAISSVKWLNDNRTITFLGENSNELPQVYSLNVESKKIDRLTNHETVVVAYDIDSRGENIIFEAHPPATKKIDTEQTRRNGIAITGGYPDDILTSDCNTERNPGSEEFYEQRRSGIATLIKTDDFLTSWEPLSISPNGHYALVAAYLKKVPERWSEYEDAFLHRYIVETHNAGTYSGIVQYMVVDLNNKSMQPLIDGPVAAGTMGYAWAKDGNSIVVSGTFLPLDTADPAERQERKRSPFAVEVMLPHRQYVPITSRPGEVRKWSPSSGELLLLSRDEPVAWLSYQKLGASWSLLHTDVREQTRGIDVVLQEDLDTPPKLYAVDHMGGQKALLLDPNPQFRHLAFGRVEEVRWKATDGHEVVGGLYLPPDYTPGRRYPLVIQTHGFDRSRFWIDGPFSSAFAAQPMAALGIVVVQVGGATHHDGRTFTNTPGEAPREMAAYEGVIDYLDQRGIIDRNRVGIIGFSRTVFKVGYTLTHSSYNFAAATLADGVDGGYVNYILFQGADSAGVNGGMPSGESLGLWLKNAPGFNLDKVTAPVRIEGYGYASLLGGWEWFSGLSFRDKPVDFVWIPYGTHLLVKPWERLVSQQGNVDWFVYWLLDRTDPDPEKRDQYRRWERLRMQHPQGLESHAVKGTNPAEDSQ
jgi:hypothetical protein